MRNNLNFGFFLEHSQLKGNQDLFGKIKDHLNLQSTCCLTSQPNYANPLNRFSSFLKHHAGHFTFFSTKCPKIPRNMRIRKHKKAKCHMDFIHWFFSYSQFKHIMLCYLIVSIRNSRDKFRLAFSDLKLLLYFCFSLLDLFYSYSF